MYLRKDFHTPGLDELYAYLWLVAKKSSRHIDALHEHRIKRRTIVPAENPALHLVWHYDTVYLKPLPPYLMNYSFWHSQLLPSNNALGELDLDGLTKECRSALGFLRSYSYLIQHDSDFCIAQQAKLIPADISYSAFRDFIKYFQYIPDDVIFPRYHYGQLRLTRLNWAVRIYRPSSTGCRFPWNYQERYWQTGEYLERFVAPLLFIFAILSVILSAMQVVLAALGSNMWTSFVWASWGFSIAVLLLNAVIVASALLGIVVLLLAQGKFAVMMHRRDLSVK